MRQTHPSRSARKPRTRSGSFDPLFVELPLRRKAQPSVARRLERAEEALARWRASIPFLLFAWLCVLWLFAQNVHWARRLNAQVSAELTAGKVRWSR